MNENRLGLNNKGRPTEVFQYLMRNPQFLHRYIDRANELLTGDGWLTEKAVVSVWDSLYHTIENAIYDESARWGDYRRVVHQYTSKGKYYEVDTYYMDERNRLLNDYFPYRTSQFLYQLTQQEWFPHTEAPRLLLNGKAIETDTLTQEDQLTLSAQGMVYFTRDGNAPVSWAGADTKGHLSTSAKLYKGENVNFQEQEGEWITIRAIAQNNGEWSPAIQHRFFVAVPSAIYAMHNEETISDNVFYNLNGQRVNHPAKGIYIKNGKKVFVK